MVAHISLVPGEQLPLQRHCNVQLRVCTVVQAALGYAPPQRDCETPCQFWLEW